MSVEGAYPPPGFAALRDGFQAGRLLAFPLLTVAARLAAIVPGLSGVLSGDALGDWWVGVRGGEEESNLL